MLFIPLITRWEQGIQKKQLLSFTSKRLIHISMKPWNSFSMFPYSVLKFLEEQQITWSLCGLLKKPSKYLIALSYFRHLNIQNIFFNAFFFHRELTKVPHMATTAGDEQTVQFMLKRWQDPETGLDQAWREEYMVYLSFPDRNNPNKVTVGESTGCKICLN